MTEANWALVAGAGPGLGHALLERFQAGGLQAVGLTRSPEVGSEYDIRRCDLSQSGESRAILAAILRDFGPPRIVVHNTAQLVRRPFLETTEHDFEACWESIVKSAVVLGQGVLQPMVRGGGGAFLVSGATASLRGGAHFGAFASAKFALRGLTQSLAREFQGAGVHVAHIILDGIIDSERSRDLHGLDPSKMMRAGDIADVFWQLAHQPRSTWTHELDLRPRTEIF